MGDKKNILLICCTYYQLLVAIQLRLTQFADSEMYIVIAGRSRNLDKIAKKVQEEKLFSQVIFIDANTSSGRSYRIFSTFLMTMKCIFGFHKNVGFLKQLPMIDVLLFFNLDSFSRIIYSRLIRKNPHMICSRFEECLASYYHELPKTPSGKISRVIYTGMHLLGKKTIEEQTNTFYCFMPELYDGRLTPVAVKPICAEDENLIAILKRIFSIRPEDLSYTQKYIYFASAVDSDNGASIEFDLVQKLANILGKENILIKMHPRDKRTIYEDNGYSVDRNSTIPWEVLQFCIDLSDKVLISTFSSSVLSSSVMIDGGVETWFLYKLCDCPSFTASIVSPIEEIIGKMDQIEMSNKIKVIQSFNEIQNEYRV